jgi:hypothetical protein
MVTNMWQVSPKKSVLTTYTSKATSSLSDAEWYKRFLTRFRRNRATARKNYVRYVSVIPNRLHNLCYHAYLDSMESL